MRFFGRSGGPWQRRGLWRRLHLFGLQIFRRQALVGAVVFGGLGRDITSQLSGFSPGPRTLTSTGLFPGLWRMYAPPTTMLRTQGGGAGFAMRALSDLVCPECFDNPQWKKKKEFSVTHDTNHVAGCADANRGGDGVAAVASDVIDLLINWFSSSLSGSRFGHGHRHSSFCIPW